MTKRRPRLAEMDRYSEEHWHEYRRLRSAVEALNLRAEATVSKDGAIYLRGSFDLDDLMRIIGVLQEGGWIE